MCPALGALNIWAQAVSHRWALGRGRGNVSLGKPATDLQAQAAPALVCHLLPGQALGRFLQLRRKSLVTTKAEIWVLRIILLAPSLFSQSKMGMVIHGGLWELIAHSSLPFRGL